MEKELLEQMYLKDKLSIEEISCRTKISVKTVKKNIVSYSIVRVEDYMKKEWLYEKHYVKKMGIKQIAKSIAVSVTTIRHWMNVHVLVVDKKICDESKKKYRENTNFFDDIDSEEKAYWLGFLMADGSIRDYMIRLGLGRKDKDHLEKFIVSLGSNRKVEDYEQAYSKGGKVHKMSRLIINSAHMRKKLRSHGLSERKSLNEVLPELAPEMISHFIRGYFDGDGCFTHGIRDRGGEYCSVQLLGGQKYLEEIKQVINNRDISANVYHKNNDLYVLSMAHNQGIEFLKYIYKDATIYLDRKFEKYQAYINGGKPRNRLEVHKEEMVPIYEMVWGLRQEGMTHQAVADALNEKGIQTIKNTPYSEGAVRRALKKREELLIGK
jgi:predicted DNA-binding protein YlxM (UPF0122 family)